MMANMSKWEDLVSWAGVIKSANIKGAAGQLARHCQVTKVEPIAGGFRIVLTVDKEGEFLVSQPTTYRLCRALCEVFQEPLRLTIYTVRKEQK
jgi:hypothetical protein